MTEYILDATQMQEDVHGYLAEYMGFPEYYGRNLDALYDMLTSMTEETEIYLLHWDELGEQGERLLEVMMDAQDENDNLTIYHWN